MIRTALLGAFLGLQTVGAAAQSMDSMSMPGMVMSGETSGRQPSDGVDHRRAPKSSTSPSKRMAGPHSPTSKPLKAAGAVRQSDVGASTEMTADTPAMTSRSLSDQGAVPGTNERWGGDLRPLRRPPPPP